MRRGDWMHTFTGARIYPWSPRAQDIRIEDIAHSLAQLPRFGGHLPEPYSVGQHCLLVARHCPPEYRLIGLLHDAAEAYIGDMVRPVKEGLLSFQLLEHRIWQAISTRFELPESIPEDVKAVDARALVTEVRQLIPPPHGAWGDHLPWPPLPETIKPLPWKEVKRGFIELFELLWLEREAVREAEAVNTGRVGP